MWDIITKLFSSNSYIPHGHCYLWQSSLVWLHVVSDVLIALAYYSIPGMLIYFVRQRNDIPFRGVFLLFGAFILSCGTTHILEVWTLWKPTYWLSGSVKLFTAMISMYTAINLIPLIPKALSIPSSSQLEALNYQLQQQINERQVAEQIIRELNAELEKRVEERTVQLKAANEQLKYEIEERQNIEITLRKNQKFTQRITELTPNLLLVYDLIEHKNIYCNRFITEILGYTSTEIKNMNQNLLLSLVHPGDKDKLIQHQERCLTLRDDNYIEIEYRIKDSQNHWHWIKTRKTVFSRTADNQAQQILTIASDITPNKQAQLELQEANFQLAERVQELENRTQEMILLGEMTDFLQACLSVSEAESTLSDLVKPLFDKCSGVIFILNKYSNLLESVATWGENSNTTNWLLPHDCWALRRGSYHLSSLNSPALFCKHIDQNTTLGRTLCVPMMAQGETLGLLYLHLPVNDNFTLAQQRLAQAVSKQIAISLANLELRETLQYQSFRDALTGLFNRRYLQASMTRELHRVSREKQKLGVMMIDIDHFKKFNDTFGHYAGDLVLQSVGNFLQENLRQSDIACRYGGEEFAIIMPNVSLENIQERAEQFRQKVKELKLNYNNQPLESITFSLGIALFPDHAETSEQLFRVADEALYQAKKKGRDCVICP